MRSSWKSPWPASSWNTDATGLSSGDTVGPGISTDEAGNPRNNTLALEILKYYLFDSLGKGSLVDYGGAVNADYTGATDQAPPVLHTIQADRYASSADGRSDHNYFHLVYSEPVDLDATEAGLQSGGGATNLQATENVALGAGNYGGDIDDAVGTVVVEGFFDYAGTFQSGSWTGTPPNALWRPDTHSLDIFIVGHSTAGPSWDGYIVNATDPLGAAVTIIDNDDITDTSPANSQLDHTKGATAVTAGGTPWDIDPPAFAPYLSSATIKEAITVDLINVVGIIDRIEFHVLDNSADEPGWDSTSDHNDGNGGIRDNTLNINGFEFGLTGSGSFTNTDNSGFTSVVTSDLYTNSGPDDTDTNDPYFTIQIDDGSATWSAVDQLDFRYDSSVGRMTDLAGNLLPSDLGLPYPQTIERTPPRVSLSLSILGEDKVYLRFSEVVYPVVGLTFMPDDFDFSGFTTPSVVTSIDTFGLAHDAGITEMVLTLDNSVLDQDFFGGTFNIVANSIQDFLSNEMVDTEVYPASALGIDLVTPLWASDGFGGETNQSGTARVINSFDGDDSLFDQDIDLQLRVNTVDAGLLALPVALFYDANDDPITLFDGDNWLPFTVGGINNAPNVASRLILPYNSSGALHNFIIPSSDPDMAFGKKIDFLPRVGTLLNVYSNNPNDPSDFSLYNFSIRDLTRQKGGVTVLNNIINPTLGEQAQVIYSMEDSGIATVQVFALDGSIVRVLHRGRQAAGEYKQFWDGRNEAGDIVARGMYFVRVVAPGVDEMRNILLVK